MTDGAVQQPTSPAETTSSPATTTSTTTVPPATVETPAVAPAPSIASQPVALTAEAFTMPEGFSIDDDTMTAFLGVFNNAELSPAQRGQALIELQAGLSTKSEEARSQAWMEQRQNWVKAITDDPEIGGPNFQSTLQSIGTLMDRYANDDVRQVFDQSGIGDHPAVVKFLHTLSKQLVEAKPAAVGAPAAAPARSLADRIYTKTS